MHNDEFTPITDETELPELTEQELADLATDIASAEEMQSADEPADEEIEGVEEDAEPVAEPESAEAPVEEPAVEDVSAPVAEPLEDADVTSGPVPVTEPSATQQEV